MGTERERLRSHLAAHPTLHYRGLESTLVGDAQHKRSVESLRTLLLSDRGLVEFMVCRAFLRRVAVRASVNRDFTSASIVGLVQDWLRANGIAGLSIGEGSVIAAGLASGLRIHRASVVGRSVFLNVSGRSLADRSHAPLDDDLRPLLLAITCSEGTAR